MAEQPISLDGADGVSPGAPNANAEGGDPVGEVVAPPFLFGRAVVAVFFLDLAAGKESGGSMWSWRSPDESSESMSYCSFWSIE